MSRLLDKGVTSGAVGFAATFSLALGLTMAALTPVLPVALTSMAASSSSPKVAWTRVVMVAGSARRHRIAARTF